MALTFDQLKAMLTQEGLQYYIHPTQTSVMLGFGGLRGTYQFGIRLEMDGQFLQFRSLGYLNCQAGHANLAEVLKLLGKLNYEVRLVKFGWDPSDGEVVAYADVWVMDGTVTQAQFHRMLQNYLPTIDTNSVRIRTTMETGKDPGEEDPAKLVEKVLGGKGQLPEEIRKLVEKITGKKPPEPGPEKKGPEFDQI